MERRRQYGNPIGLASCPAELPSRAAQRALANANANTRIHHSDRGSQYASELFRDFLADEEVEQSMSRKGNCYDNALMESFWATLKTECFDNFRDGIPATRQEAKQNKKPNRSCLATSKCSTIANACTRLWAIARPSSLNTVTSLKRRMTFCFPYPHNQGKIISPDVAPRERRWNSASPATQHSVRRVGRRQPDQTSPTAQELLQELFKTLELPGELNDYHSAISISCSSLWSHRRDAPWVSPAIERFCLLEIRLLEVFPNFRQDAHPDSYTDNVAPLRYAAFDNLVRLYEREGYLLEAMDVAERAKRMGQGDELADQLRERVEALRAEGGIVNAP